jgi:hypothetical protein
MFLVRVLGMVIAQVRDLVPLPVVGLSYVVVFGLASLWVGHARPLEPVLELQAVIVILQELLVLVVVLQVKLELE